MATRASAGGHAAARDDERTPAQWYAYLIGATLLLVGIAGFFVDSAFDTGNNLQGDKLIAFEVNGWHNVVHILSGLFLLAMAPKRKTAKTGVLAFAAIYAIVTIIGLVDGEDVLGLIPVNPADNVLHIALTVLALAAALVSRDHDPVRGGGDGDVDSPGRATTVR